MAASLKKAQARLDADWAKAQADLKKAQTKMRDRFRRATGNAR